jgi:hypothetical protein
VKKWQKQRPERRNIELLASIEDPGATHSPATKTFGNIIELDSRGLVVETGTAIRVGAAVTVRVVFPDQARGNTPFAHLHCSVQEQRDDASPHYGLTIVEMDEQSRERLDSYLARSGASRWA